MLMSNAIEKVQTYICWLDALVVVRCHNLIKVDQQNLFITIVMECVITTEQYQQQSLIKSLRFFYITSSYDISIPLPHIRERVREGRNIHNSIKHYLIKWLNIQRAFIVTTLLQGKIVHCQICYSEKFLLIRHYTCRKK